MRWQIAKKITKEIINDNPDVEPIVLQLLANRGLIKKEEIKYFLEADYKSGLHDPFLFKDMAVAIDLVIKHIKAGKKIAIYGDYDADGVTATTLLKQILEILKAKVSIYIPDRVNEGYGLNETAINLLEQENVQLIITVDTGIRNKKEIDYALNKGIDVIVTDHHIPPDEESDYPNCPIIDAVLPNEAYPFKKLAGVGAAFKLAQALISKAKLKPEQKTFLEEIVLDLVAIGSIADIVPLLGENRILVKRGMEMINNSNRLGLIELLEIVRLKKNKKIDTWNIAFQIAPRLNAAGRLDHANTSFKLLDSKDRKEAKDLAMALDLRNQERQSITEEISEQVKKQLKNNQDEILIGVCPNGIKIWSEGVVGLVAGKICEKYYRPVLIITKTEDGYKGSGRSIPEFNVIAAVEACKEYLTSYGGHPAACGFSFLAKNKDDFFNKIKELAKKQLAKTELTPEIKIDALLNIEEINQDLFKEIQSMAPFGHGNSQPKFLSKRLVISDRMIMGANGEHVKFKFGNLWALVFGRAMELADYKIGDLVDIVYNVDINEFNGREEVQLKLVDIKNSL